MAASEQIQHNHTQKINEPFHPALTRLDNGTGLPEGIRLTQAAKRLYARFTRQHLAAASKGRDSFRAKISTLAEDLQIADRTVRRAIAQLKAAELVQVVRTGRSSYYRLLPLSKPEPTTQPDTASTAKPTEAIVDKSIAAAKADRPKCPIGWDKTTDPHLKAFVQKTYNGTDPNSSYPHSANSTCISPALKSHIEKRLQALDFKYYVKGVKGPLSADRLCQRFGTSWVLSWTDKAEDGLEDGSIRNPAAWLKHRLDFTFKSEPYTTA